MAADTQLDQLAETRERRCAEHAVTIAVVLLREEACGD
jgi:hypothetical protein